MKPVTAIRLPSQEADMFPFDMLARYAQRRRDARRRRRMEELLDALDPEIRRDIGWRRKRRRRPPYAWGMPDS